jgi:anthranilate synthase component 2
MILVLDNRDSFTFNIVQAVQALGGETEVRGADDPELPALRLESYCALIAGPGPGHPAKAGACRDLVLRFLGWRPVLGICLGHQVLGMICGAEVIAAPQPKHGKVEPIGHCGEGIFRGLEQGFDATRYHSLALARADWPERLEITAETDDGVIMAINDRTTGAVGLQFHPESVGCPAGDRLLANFLEGL